MFRILLWFLLMTTVVLAGQDCSAQTVSGGERDLSIIADRLREELIARTASYRRYSRRQNRARTSPSDRIRQYLGQQKADGSWPEIDYQDRSRTHWSPSRHTRVLTMLAGAYRTPGSELTGDRTLKEAILSGLTFWVDQDPQSDNWWYNCIDTPGKLGNVLLLMEDVVPNAVLRKAEQIIRRSSFKRTGANLIWEAGNLLVLACVIRDVDLLQAAIEHITREIRITTDEGIQADFSFHQHGPQLYMSNYGEVFSSNNSRYAALLAGTAFALSREEIRILSGLILEGQQWFMWGRQFDYHALGRQVDSPGATWRGRRFRGVCDRMAAADPEHAEDYRNFAARLSGEQQPGETGPRGNRHFWRSDIMVHRPGHFYVSVRMHSTRTYATEARVNRENLKGYHLSDGAYFPMQRGDEYHEIQPVWDWRKLPGVTYKDTDEPFPYGREARRSGNTDFVGGVSDGRMGAAAMDYAKEDVKARKAWFFFDAGWICLGAGISTETDHHVTTSVNQCLLKSRVSLLRGGGMGTMDGQRLEAGDLEGVLHDGVGTYFLEAQSTVVARAGPQSGAWTSIEERSTRRDPVTQDVFSLWIDHGARPQGASYAYMVIPGLTPDTFPTFTENTPVRVLSNSPELQAVYVSDQQVVQAAFYKAGSLAVGEGRTIRVDVPCLLMLRLREDAADLSVADPTQKLGRIQVTLDGRYAGDGSAYLAEENTTTIAVDLPKQALAGSTIQLALCTE